MATVTSTGIGSGLDISSLVTQLVNAEIQPQQSTLTTKQSQLQSQISALGSFKSVMSTLNDSITALTTGSALSAYQASSSNTDLVTASASSDAQPGTYDIEVLGLASAQQLGSGAYHDATTTAIGTGTLTLTVNGKSFAVNVQTGGNTLNNIRDAINSASDNSGVTASVINGDDGAHLVLTSTVGGTANKITVTQAGGDGGLSGLVYDPANSNTQLSELQPANDAQFKVNGYLHTSSTNVVTDAVAGVTFNLLQKAPGTHATVSVTGDSSAQSKSIQSFVTAFNAVITSLSQLTAYDATSKTAGALLGDPAVLSVGQSLRRLVGGSANVGGAFQNLSQLGITTNTDGTLKVDSAKLGAALQNNHADAARLLSGTGGILTQLSSTVSSFIGATGAIQAETDSANSGLKTIEDQLTALSTRQAQLQKTYLTQFNAMDQLVAQLKSTGDFLTQQLANLPFTQKSSG